MRRRGDAVDRLIHVFQSLGAAGDDELLAVVHVEAGDVVVDVTSASETAMAVLRAYPGEPVITVDQRPV